MREISSRTAQVIARRPIKKDTPDAVHSCSSKVHSSAVQYIIATELSSVSWNHNLFGLLPKCYNIGKSL